MKTENQWPNVEDLMAARLPPEGFEEYVVVETHGLLVWMKPEDIGPGDFFCFYDGDCREVLRPDDPQVRQRFS